MSATTKGGPSLQDIINKIAEIRNVPQLLYIHEISPSNFMNLRLIIKNYKNSGGNMDEIDLVIQSPGGSPDDGYRIIRYLRDHFTTVNAVVPFWAKSAATLLILGASKIVLGDCGELGPLDMQLGVPFDDRPGFDRESALTDEFSLKQIEDRSLLMSTRFFNFVFQNENIPINKDDLFGHAVSFYSSFYQPLLSQINPYKIGKKARMLAIGKQYAIKIMQQYCPNVSVQSRQMLVDYLVNNCPDHGFGVDFLTLKPYLDHVMRPADISPEYDLEVENLTDIFLNLPPAFNYINLILPPLPAVASPSSGKNNTSKATENGTSGVKGVDTIVKPTQQTTDGKQSKSKSANGRSKASK